MRRAVRLLPVLTLAAAAACVDGPRTPVGPEPGGGTPGGPVGRPVTVQSVQCSGSRTALTLTCGTPQALPDGVSADLLVGGQGTYVQVTTSNVAYNSGTGQFTFNVTLQNLIEQPMGTLDGTTPAAGGTRIFFHTGPTVTGGTGSASVLPDGFATFTSAGQPFYQFNGVLDQNEVSPVDTWTLIMPPTVTTFEFVLFVSAPVQFPDGYVTLNGLLPGSAFGNLHPSSPANLTAVVKTAVGNVDASAPAVTFGTSDAACATVSSGGVVTGVRASTCSITATSGARSGSLTFDVTGTQRTWDGSASTDWSNAANWVGDVLPAAVDTALIPAGVPNMPTLSAASAIGGVQVADNALLDLGSFDLTVSQNVVASALGGSGITGGTGTLLLTGAGKTVGGNLPVTRVTGSYSLSADVVSRSPAQVYGGQLTTGTFLFRTSAF